MSAIFGIVQLDGRPVEAGDLESIRDAMAHRGPDGDRIWRDGCAGLGQSMLCTTPESLHETLPWQCPESGLVITADARIDNREELAAKLGLRSAGSRGAFSAVPGSTVAGTAETSRESHLGEVAPDSLLVLEGYKRWGEACVDHLLGDFAFAIWDPRARMLFCARDQMGARPFYFHRSRGLFVFASTALGVVASGRMARRVRPERIADFLVQELEGADTASTWFEDVWRMPPATTGMLAEHGFTTRTYWRPDPKSELRLPSDEAYTDAFEEVLTAAVKVRMRSNKPISSMLSGGLDSSTIAGIANRLQRDAGGPPLATVSGVAEDGQECRESRYSGRVIELLRLDAARIRPSQVADHLERIDRVHAVTEDPFDLIWTHHQMVYLASRESGRRAVMDGIDGDGVASLTGSYPRYLLRSGKMRAAHHELIASCRVGDLDPSPAWRRYPRTVASALTPGFMRDLLDREKRVRRELADEGCLLSEQWIDSLQVVRRLLEYRARCNLGAYRTLREAHAARITVPYLTAGIERYGRLAASCGVEARAPLLDRRVVEFCVSLPWDQLVRNGWPKFGLRRVAERYLGSAIAWRSGRNEVMSRFWVAWGDLRKENVARELREADAALAGGVDQIKLEKNRSAYIMYGASRAHSVVNLALLLLWLRRNGFMGDKNDQP